MSRRLTTLVLSAAIAAVLAAPAFAEGVGGVLHDSADATGSDNVGDFISGVIYGNTSNPSGNGNGVLPSWSPGPWKCNSPCSDPTLPGGSMGDFISPATSGGKSNANFANDKSLGPDFAK